MSYQPFADGRLPDDEIAAANGGTAETRRIDLNMLAVDLAEVLSGSEYDIDVDSRDVLRGLVPFIDTIAPVGTLTDAQRIGRSL